MKKVTVKKMSVSPKPKMKAGGKPKMKKGGKAC